MEVTEAPPETLADAAGQDADRFFASGWAARGDLPELVAAALPEAMVSRLAANVELAHQLALAEKERDELRAALADTLVMAGRYQAETERHAAAERVLRERVARQRQTIESLRRQLALPVPVRVLVSAARRWSR